MVYHEYAGQVASLISYLYGQLEYNLGATGATVLILALGIALYASIVGTFYLKLSRKVLYDVSFVDQLGKPKGVLKIIAEILSFIIRYTIVFPLYTFLWFVILTVLLYLLSRSVSLDSAFLLAISVVVAIRITAYYDENVSVDLAKLLPLTLLAVLLVDQPQFTQEVIQNRVTELVTRLPAFVPFLFIAVATEWVLRVLLAFKRVFAPVAEKRMKEKR